MVEFVNVGIAGLFSKAVVSNRLLLANSLGWLMKSVSCRG